MPKKYHERPKGKRKPKSMSAKKSTNLNKVVKAMNGKKRSY